jgi:short-subunit dehydrogenase
MVNKVVIITGASSGIGLACAREFASRGASVIMASRNETLTNILAGEMVYEGYDAFSVRTDVTVEAECKNLITETITRYGRIDVLINNAGISMRALLSDVEIEVLKRVMDVNFWGMVYCTKYALPYLLESKGSLAGISSIAGFHGLPGRSGYSASKFAMQGFLESVRIENLKRGLHVLIAAPGFTSSNIRKSALAADGSPQGESPRQEDKMMPAEVVARHIISAINKRKRSLVLSSYGRTTLFLKKFAPEFLDRIVYDHMAREPDSPF